jgi:dienelactone hydrolase
MSGVGERSELHPDVSVAEPRGAVTAVALVLPGGKARSEDPMSPRQLAAVRMRPFAHSLALHGRAHGLAVWTAQYRVRGWNGAAASPVQDARWALDEVRRRHGGVPVALIGHSMGGRTAIQVAGDEAVRSVVGLAPWIESGDPVAQLAGRSLLIAHGDKDVITSARNSERFAAAAARVTSPVARVSVRGDIHAMVVRWRTWHQLATDWTLASLGMAALPSRLQRAIDRGGDGDFAVTV